MNRIVSLATIRKTIDAEKERILEVGKFLHANPETGFEEFRAAKRITATLKELGYDIETPYAGLRTAFRATLQGGKRGNAKIAVLAEYDALAGLGHGCGHNLIATAAVAAAAGMAGSQHDWPGQFEIIGTPGEETLAGKDLMAKAGAFDHLDVCFMTHPSTENKISQGCTANKVFMARFKGKAAHAAAAPQDGINALDAAVLFYASINSLRQHLREHARIHAIIPDGGTVVNVIPERADVQVCYRSLDERYLDELGARLRNACRGAAKAVGATVAIRARPQWYRVFKLNRPLTEIMTDAYARAGLVLNVGAGVEGRGSLDTANVSHVTPASHPYFSIVPNHAKHVALHTREFLQYANASLAYRQALIAGTGMALAAVRLLADPKALREVSDDFKKKR